MAQLIETAETALETIRSLGYQPVIVVDDSDASTKGRDDAEQAELVSAFFGRTLEAVTKLPCGLVVAIRREDQHRAQFQQAHADWGVLQRNIELPLMTSGHLERVLDHRLQTTAGVSRSAVLSSEASADLASINREQAESNLRTVLAIAHDALARAIDNDAELVDAGHVATAARQHLP